MLGCLGLSRFLILRRTKEGQFSPRGGLWLIVPGLLRNWFLVTLQVEGTFHLTVVICFETRRFRWFYCPPLPNLYSTLLGIYREGKVRRPVSLRCTGTRLLVRIDATYEQSLSSYTKVPKHRLKSSCLGLDLQWLEGRLKLSRIRHPSSNCGTACTGLHALWHLYPRKAVLPHADSLL